ncbi:MAG TPA: hypothetical protein VGH32_01155, partial [Pirellulales bacterium]
NHFYRSVIDALEFDGPALVCCYTTCQPEHGVADNMATDQARLAVDTRAFPLLIYDPRKGDTIRRRLSLQGNPAVSEDWWTNPKSGQQVDFIDFARSEGRFAKHFDKEGNPSPTLLYAKQDRLENWHSLQELAGVLGGSKPASKPAGAKAVAAPKSAAEKSAAAKVAAAKAAGNGSAAKATASETTNGLAVANGSAATNGADPAVMVDFKIGMKIKYHDGSAWVPGVVESIEPAVLALEDDTEIRTSLAVLEAGAAEGLIVGV